MSSSFSRLRRSPFARRASVVLLVLTCSRLAFGAEIHDAARDGNVARVTALLKSNPGLVSSTDGEGMTPLHWAAEKGRKDVAALLLANQAEVNAKSVTGWTPLHYAADWGDKDMVEFLLANNADVNAKTVDGLTPLHLVEMETIEDGAVAVKHKDVAQLLRNHGGHE